MSFEVQGIILVSADDLNEGKSEYARFGKVGLTVMWVSFIVTFLQMAHEWACFQMKKHLGVTLPNTLFHMCKSNQFYLNLT